MVETACGRGGHCPSGRRNGGSRQPRRWRKGCVNSCVSGRHPVATVVGSGDNRRMPSPDALSPVRLGRPRPPMAGYGLALLASLSAVAVAAAAQRYLGLTDLSLVFMLAVLLVAARTDTGPAMLAPSCSIFCSYLVL